MATSITLATVWPTRWLSRNAGAGGARLPDARKVFDGADVSPCVSDGESYPVASNRTDGGRQQNRRGNTAFCKTDGLAVSTGPIAPVIPRSPGARILFACRPMRRCIKLSRSA